MSGSTTNYAMRFIPPGTKLPYSGGVYATRESVNSPVVAASLNTGGVNQKWQLEPVKGGASTYHISQPIDPSIHIGPVSSGLGLDPTGVHIVLSPSMTELAFTQVDPCEVAHRFTNRILSYLAS